MLSALQPVGHAVQVRIAADQIDVRFAGVAQRRRECVLHLLQRLFDDRMAGGIEADNLPQARERLQDGDGIGGGVERTRRGAHRAPPPAAAAAKPIIMRDGCQMCSRQRAS